MAADPRQQTPRHFQLARDAVGRHDGRREAPRRGELDADGGAVAEAEEEDAPWVALGAARLPPRVAAGPRLFGNKAGMA